MTTTPQTLLDTLPPHLRGKLARIAATAESHGATLWLVGGVIRDLFLGIVPDRDLDLAVEGDTPTLAHALAHTLGGDVVALHQTFGTATLTLPTEDTDAPLTLDLATTRTEHYPHPAALPVVRPAPIHDDLHRRDFRVNAMALRLEAEGEGLRGASFLDPYQGQSDLRQGLLRVLHDQSFVDDPTRMLRGVRQAARLQMHFDPHTRALLDAALAHGLLEATTPDRVRTELCLALEEPDPSQVLRLADDLGLTPHIAPSLHWSATHAEHCRCVAQLVPPPERAPLYAGVLTYHLNAAERTALIERYHLPGEVATLLHDIATVQAHRPAFTTTPLRNSEIDHLLRPVRDAALFVARCAEPPALAATLAHYQAIRHTTPALNGHALQQMGLAPGPALGRILRALRAARLDGEVTTRAEEEAWVRQHLDP